MTVENEAPGKRSTCELQGASKCSSKASVGGLVVGFTGELHRFSSGEVFFRWQAVWFEANIDTVDAHASTHWFKQSKQWNSDWSTCWSMHANIEWVHCSWAWPRPQIIWSCRDRRVIYSMRGRSRRMIMIGRASFIGLMPRHWITIAAIQWQFLATKKVWLPYSSHVQLLQDSLTQCTALPNFSSPSIVFGLWLYLQKAVL